jgi:glycosyltransferase involved in cell wall biosynthesis
MTKVLLLSHIFPPAIDGGSRVIYKLGQQFKAKGYDTLYLSSNCFSTDDFSQKRINITKELEHQRTNAPENKKIIKIPTYTCFRKPLKLLEIICTKFLFINPKSNFISLIKVSQKGPIFKFFPFIKATIKIVKFKPDLIVAGPLPTTIVLYTHLLKSISKALTHQRSKVLINASFHPTDQDFHQLPLIRSLQSADYLWALTNFETDYFVNNFKINPKKIILAGNGVDSDFLLDKTDKLTSVRQTDDSDKLNILFIGSLSAHKRVDLLINSFSLLLKAKSYLLSAKLIIAGQKTLFYPQIEKTFKSLPPKIKKQIKFVFDFPQDKLTKLIDNCTFLVLPSIQESFGLVLVEAWARGKPVIVSDIPSLSEIVNLSKGGLIFKKDNQADLVKKIKQFIDSPETCRQYGQNGLNYVKTNYTWEKVSQKISQKIRLS